MEYVTLMDKVQKKSYIRGKKNYTQAEKTGNVKV